MARDIAQVIKNSGKSDSVAFVIDDRVDVVWQARDKGIKVDGVHISQNRYGTAGRLAAARRGRHRGPVRRDRKSGEAYQRAAGGCIDYIGAGHVIPPWPGLSWRRQRRFRAYA
ncbi:MAG: thiamine phosphate synthase [Bifidobacterium adolescentis]